MTRVANVNNSGAPDDLRSVERGEHYGLVVDGGGVLVDGGGGLGAEVAVAGIEVQSADVVGAVGAGELHATLDASDGVEALHIFQCSLFAAEGKTQWWGGEGNQGRVSKWKNGSTLRLPGQPRGGCPHMVLGCAT
ncbi:MAG: hypothetical protein WBV69_08795 [Candidatus Sulfotelmatobacter sp.]